MALYLTLSEGPRADTARPILAVSDRRIIDATLEAIRTLGDAPGGPALVTSEQGRRGSLQLIAQEGEAVRR
jgi:hypothetical protein